MPDLSDSLTQQQFDAVERAVAKFDSLAVAAAKSGEYDLADKHLVTALHLQSIIGGRTPE